MQCTYSSNGHEIDTAKKAHAILFHPRLMKKTRREFRGLPPYRDHQQKWIFYESEVPTNVWGNIGGSVDKTYEFWTMFNLTATITSDSDIPLHHFHMKCQPKADFRQRGENYASGKSKMAAWFVSHCVTSSQREVYVNELKNYIDVDIFGECGNNTTCNRKQSHIFNHKVCMYDLIDRDYWFYLSFENAFCDEYVTEKFHSVVRKANVIPVVLGAADYANILPKGSYIDVRDFGSVKELADFLIQLTKDPERYNSYIEKTHAHDCRFPRLSFECNLCEYLHNHRRETHVIYDAQSFWSVEQRCVSPKEFYGKFAPEIVPKIKFVKDPDIFL
ncbi:hypothetical protein CAPTEDRAFT_120726 [Capitella teleta]|uniref:Fucosyltransferase n=1 Tax=Capitella teleta TaxID=283909 RepID=R7UIV6_CAPTE|nr:hypothetical protein CAPTEDRAFT_120726 [Capitella teleta]|eukprot:ELU03217.1 hypothetical protein CAPTEDRAFT_120726 [Capitella teleta]